MKHLFLALALALSVSAAPVMAAEDAFPLTLEEVLEEGERFMETGNYEQALSSYEEATAMAPNDKAVQQRLADAKTKAVGRYVEEGYALIDDKAFGDAVNVFQNALDIDPKSAPAQKGKTLAENWPKANAYVKEAKARFEKGEYDHAIAYFQKAFDLTGDAEIKSYLDAAKAKKK